MLEIARPFAAAAAVLLVAVAIFEAWQQFRHASLDRPELRCSCGRMGWSDRCRPLSRTSSRRDVLQLPPPKPATWEARLARQVTALMRRHVGYEDLR